MTDNMFDIDFDPNDFMDSLNNQPKETNAIDDPIDSNPIDEKTIEYKTVVASYDINTLIDKWNFESNVNWDDVDDDYTIVYLYGDSSDSDINNDDYNYYFSYGQMMKCPDDSELNVGDIVKTTNDNTSSLQGNVDVFMACHSSNTDTSFELYKEKIITNDVDDVNDSIDNDTSVSYDDTTNTISICADNDYDGIDDFLNVINAVTKLYKINPTLFKIKFNTMASDFKLHKWLADNLDNNKGNIALSFKVIYNWELIFEDQKKKSKHNRKQFGDKYIKPYDFASNTIINKYGITVEQLKKLLAMKSSFKQKMVK